MQDANECAHVGGVPPTNNRSKHPDCVMYFLVTRFAQTTEVNIVIFPQFAPLVVINMMNRNRRAHPARTAKVSARAPVVLGSFEPSRVAVWVGIIHACGSVSQSVTKNCIQGYFIRVNPCPPGCKSAQVCAVSPCLFCGESAPRKPDVFRARVA